MQRWRMALSPMTNQPYLGRSPRSVRRVTDGTAAATFCVITLPGSGTQLSLFLGTRHLLLGRLLTNGVLAYKGTPTAGIVVSPRSVNTRQPSATPGPRGNIFLSHTTYNPSSPRPRKPESSRWCASSDGKQSTSHARQRVIPTGPHSGNEPPSFASPPRW